MERLGVATSGRKPLVTVYAFRSYQANWLGVGLTTVIAWVAIDQRGPSSFYLASDSRITWGSRSRRWDVGRKLFACKTSPDIFAYSGEVLFPSLVLGQLTEATDYQLLINNGEEPESRHAAFVRTIQVSLESRRRAPNYDFQILHAARSGEGLAAGFRLWQLSYVADSHSWSDDEIEVRTDRSGLVVVLGSGEISLREHVEKILSTSQGGTSRATFWAFCDALKSQDDPLSGGAPQLIGMYRTNGPKAFGLVYNGRRYFYGLPLHNNIRYDCIEWRDVDFQRIDGETMQIIPGAQRHGRPTRRR